LQELGAARRSAGLGLDTVGRAVGVAPSTVWRTETGVTNAPDLLLLAGIASAVGLDLRLQVYLAGDPIRDVAQQRLLVRLRGRVHASLRWATEVPLSIAGDLRAWDATIRGPTWLIGVEAETVLQDLQAIERRLALKRRDGGLDHVLLLVADTRRNRAALAAAPAAFADFSRDSRTVLRRLASGSSPGTSAIVIL